MPTLLPASPGSRSDAIRVDVHRHHPRDLESGELESQLSKAERDFLGTRRLGPGRRREWVRGRLAAGQLLHRHGIRGGSILADSEGRPLWDHPELRLRLSLSHDGDYVALAWCEGAGPRIGVDLCHRGHASTLGRLFRRFNVEVSGCDAVEAWAALECAIKSVANGVADLLDQPAQILATGGGALVRIGERAQHVHLRSCSDYALAWGPQESPEPLSAT